MFYNNINFIIIYLDDIEKAKEWLQNERHSASFEVVKEKWILTHEIRKSEFINLKTRSLCDLFDTWTILKIPKG